MADERWNWVVYDLTVKRGHNGDEPGWGPMTETEAKRMVEGNPRAYFAKQLLPPPPPQSFTLTELKDPETIVGVLKVLGWHMVTDTHTPDCPGRFRGNRCQCVPDAATWSPPNEVDKFLGEDWESRLAKAKARKDPDE